MLLLDPESDISLLPSFRRGEKETTSGRSRRSVSSTSPHTSGGALRPSQEETKYRRTQNKESAAQSVGLKCAPRLRFSVSDVEIQARALATKADMWQVI
jgi:hypothetical protein